jgi:hypothetical protein
MDTEEDMMHLLVCPALADEHLSLRRSTEEKLKTWDLPWALGKIETYQHRTCRKLVQKAQESLHKLITADRLETLAQDFYKANSQKEQVSSKTFIATVRKLVARFACQCKASEHICSIRLAYTLPKSLVHLLSQRLGLFVEARTNSLHHSSIFKNWYSDDADRAFGAEGSMMEVSLSGKNALLQYYPEDKKGEFDLLCNRIRDQIVSINPTRIVVIMPTDRVADIANPFRRAFLEIARFPVDFPFIPPGSYRNELQGAPYHLSPQSISIFVVLNKESMIMDPIDWPKLTEALKGWSRSVCPNMAIPELTDQLFRERSYVTLNPRAQTGPPPIESNIYHFFDSRLPIRNEIQQLINRGMCEGEAKAIHKINRTIKS